MDANDPIIADDVLTDEQRFENELRLKENGINPHELHSDGINDLNDDLRGDKIDHTIHDDGEDMSDVVTPEEQDGND